MLVVLAIIAVLVSVLIPIVADSVTKARAATDAANLRTVLGMANTAIVSNTVEPALTEVRKTHISCSSFPDADMYIAYCEPSFVHIAFVDGDNYYDMEYFSEVALDGASSRSTEKPNIPGAVWYKITE